MATKARAFCSDGVGMGRKMSAAPASPSSIHFVSYQFVALPARATRADYWSINSPSATSPTIWKLFAEMCSIVSCMVWW